MPWDILDSQPIVNTQEWTPGNYGAVTSVTVPNTAAGITLIAEDTTNLVRFVNLSVEPKLINTSTRILVYVGVGFNPTSSNYSFILRSGHQEQNLQINGQEYRALAQSGQTILIAVQTAIGVKR